jgi:hypothetical protein
MRPHKLALLVVCGAFASFLTADSAAMASSAPILAGPWSISQQGYGHVRPTTVSNGGDPTGVIDHIEWLTWGDSRAVGIGISTYLAPNQFTAEGTPQAAVIVLFQLGTCHRRRAYDAIEWFFPQHGEHFNSHSYLNPCTGRRR